METSLVETNLIEKNIYKSHRKKIVQVKLSAFCNTTSDKAEGLQINSDSLWQSILWGLLVNGQ